MNKRTGCLVMLVAGLVMFPSAANSSDDTHEISLLEPVPLRLRYEPGETLCYRLRRHTEFFQTDGTKFGEQKALALFERTRVEDDHEGRVRERFTWKKSAFGQSMNLDEPAQLSFLVEAEGFSLTCSVEDEDLLTKFDFSDLPRTIEGVWFMIMSWDAVTFDGPVRPQKHFDVPAAATMGTEFKNSRGTYDFSFEYPPVVTNSRYTFSGNGYSKLIGVTLVKDIPCAIIEFSNAKNMIHLHMAFESLELNGQGFEHFWGTTYLSLKDGRVVKGTLVAPVTHVQDMKMTSQRDAQHAEFFAVQRLELDLLSREEFEAEAEGDY
ncbi:MAG: hypothetical protein JSW58_16215 [Candidatus Latescibacterota bacterium]|nr:MAG: hypothetical protein JSW58_16215 [Candidatus Latescibacterota bacterium]